MHFTAKEEREQVVTVLSTNDDDDEQLVVHVPRAVWDDRKTKAGLVRKVIGETATATIGPAQPSMFFHAVKRLFAAARFDAHAL